MGTGATFTWASLGKADYSQASALVSSLPEPIRRQFSGESREVLCRLTFLVWRFATTSGRNNGYCIPSEQWLASVCGRSDRSVRRYLTVLRSLGLIQWTRRMDNRGNPLSNLYTLGKSFFASLYARMGKKAQRIQYRTKMSANDLKKGIEAAVEENVQASNSPFVEKLRDKLLSLGFAHSEAVAKSVEEEKKAVEERKALLKAQAESLKARGL